jgi:hypothetical protein
MAGEALEFRPSSRAAHEIEYYIRSLAAMAWTGLDPDEHNRTIEKGAGVKNILAGITEDDGIPGYVGSGPVEGLLESIWEYVSTKAAKAEPNAQS